MGSSLVRRDWVVETGEARRHGATALKTRKQASTLAHRPPRHWATLLNPRHNLRKTEYSFRLLRASLYLTLVPSVNHTLVRIRRNCSDRHHYGTDLL